MSADTIDDLHYAEGILGGIPGALDGYCRPSCSYHDEGECFAEDDCGCPCNHSVTHAVDPSTERAALTAEAHQTPVAIIREAARDRGLRSVGVMNTGGGVLAIVARFHSGDELAYGPSDGDLGPEAVACWAVTHTNPDGGSRPVGEGGDLARLTAYALSTFPAFAD